MVHSDPVALTPRVDEGDLDDYIDSRSAHSRDPPLGVRNELTVTGSAGASAPHLS